MHTASTFPLKDLFLEGLQHSAIVIQPLSGPEHQRSARPQASYWECKDGWNMLILVFYVREATEAPQGNCCLWPTLPFLALFSLFHVSPSHLLWPPWLACLFLSASLLPTIQAFQCHPVALTGITQTCGLPSGWGMTSWKSARAFN